MEQSFFQKYLFLFSINSSLNLSEKFLSGIGGIIKFGNCSEKISLSHSKSEYLLFTEKFEETQLKKSTLEFCGVKPVKVSYVGPIRNSTAEFRAEQLKKIEQLGAKLK